MHWIGGLSQLGNDLTADAPARLRNSPAGRIRDLLQALKTTSDRSLQTRLRLGQSVDLFLNLLLNLFLKSPDVPPHLFERQLVNLPASGLEGVADDQVLAGNPERLLVGGGFTKIEGTESLGNRVHPIAPGDEIKWP